MRALLIAALAILSGSVTHSMAAEVQFVGGFTILGQSGICPEGDQRGDEYVVRFRPRNVGDNPPDSNLNVYDRVDARGYRLVNSSFNQNFKTVEAYFVGAGSGEIDHAVRVRFVDQSPATIRANTAFVSIVGEVRGWDFQPDCTVRFRVSANRRLD
jgi:hypothetical protein